MKDKEIEELKKEINELRKQNETLSKTLQEIFKKLPEVDKKEAIDEKTIKNKAKEVLEKDLQQQKTKDFSKKSRERETAPSDRILERDPINIKDIDINLEELGPELKLIVKSAQDITKKAIVKLRESIDQITDQISRETERLRFIPSMTEDLFQEIKDEIEEAREDLEEARAEYEQAKSEVRDAFRAVKRARRELYHSSINNDSKAYQKKLSQLRTAEEQLQEALEKLEESKREIIQTRRLFANLIKRAQILRTSNMKKGKHGGKVLISSKDFDWGDTISEYFEGILGSIIKNLEKSLRSTLGALKGDDTIGKDTIISRYEDIVGKSLIREEEIDEFIEEATKLLAALGDTNRLKILKILEEGPEFQKELSQKSGLKGGTFKHHTDILSEVGFITREAVRGRYLITQLGLEALKLAELIYVRKKDFDQSENSKDADDNLDHEYEIGIE